MQRPPIGKATTAWLKRIGKSEAEAKADAKERRDVDRAKKKDKWEACKAGKDYSGKARSAAKKGKGSRKTDKPAAADAASSVDNGAASRCWLL